MLGEEKILSYTVRHDDLKDNTMALITTQQAAELLGVKRRQVQALLKQQTYRDSMKAQKLGRDWMLDEDAVKLTARVERKVGRPKEE